MNTINEMCLAWYMWVNGNYDILIMTITLIVVAGLVLEVVRLNKVLIKTNKSILTLFRHDGEDSVSIFKLQEINEDQRRVNVHLAEDISKLAIEVKHLKYSEADLLKLINAKKKTIRK